MNFKTFFRPEMYHARLLWQELPDHLRFRQHGHLQPAKVDKNQQNLCHLQAVSSIPAQHQSFNEPDWSNQQYRRMHSSGNFIALPGAIQPQAPYSTLEYTRTNLNYTTRQYWSYKI